MATTGIGFRWLDLLEKEFDKACVELDTSLSEVDPDEPEVLIAARQKIATLSSCFAQLTHKALTIFQNSAKLEAELVDMRAELIQAHASNENDNTANGREDIVDNTRARYEAQQFAKENAALRETVLALHSELFGARLATKYLDKELAGRIQQLQLLGRDMRNDLRDSLWEQVEAEILLQRHKTLVRVCRGLAPCPPRPAPPGSPVPPAPPRPRTVRVHRSPHLGLGISVTGGREHGVPILISELEAGGPAALTGELFVGDAILAINDVDLTQACHKDAVKALQSVKGDCALCVQFIATDDDDRLSDDNYRFPLYPDDEEVLNGEPDGSGATPTAPRTPDYHTRGGSEADSVAVSECEEYGKYGQYGPYEARSRCYPPYSDITNKLSILDINDDCIKIEAHHPPPPPPPPPSSQPPPPPPSSTQPNESPLYSTIISKERGRHRQLGQYRSVPLDVSSSNNSTQSTQSTPVHGRRPAPNKKRVVSTDWWGPSKGTYKAIDDDVHSIDEVRESRDPTPVNGHGISTVFDKPLTDHAITIQTDDSSPKSQDSSDLSPPEPSPVETPIAPLPPPQQVVIPSHIKTKIAKSNGLENKLLKNKAFRIGSAKRVLDKAPISNGNSKTDKINYYPTELLAGDGDPDFGTPV